MTTEMKLHYNVKQNSLKGKYRYDLVYSNDEDLLPDDIFNYWFEEVKKEGYIIQRNRRTDEGLY